MSRLAKSKELMFDKGFAIIVNLPFQSWILNNQSVQGTDIIGINELLRPNVLMSLMNSLQSKAKLGLNRTLFYFWACPRSIHIRCTCFCFVLCAHFSKQQNQPISQWARLLHPTRSTKPISWQVKEDAEALGIVMATRPMGPLLSMYFYYSLSQNILQSLEKWRIFWNKNTQQSTWMLCQE